MSQDHHGSASQVREVLLIHIPILCYFHEFFNNIFYHQGFASQNPMTQQRSGVSGLSGFSQTMSQTMDFSQDMHSGMRG